MAKQVIQTDMGAPPRGDYSQGWRAGDFISTFEDWCGSGLSDHVPIIVDIDV